MVSIFLLFPLYIIEFFFHKLKIVLKEKGGAKFFPNHFTVNQQVIKPLDIQLLENSHSCRNGAKYPPVIEKSRIWTSCILILVDGGLPQNKNFLRSNCKANCIHKRPVLKRGEMLSFRIF